MKTPYLAPFLDRRYWDGLALGDHVDSTREQEPESCEASHRLAERALTELFKTSRYPLGIRQYRTNDSLHATDFSSLSVFHIVEEMVYVDEAIPEVTSDTLPPQPSLHPGGEYIFNQALNTAPTQSDDGAVITYDRGPGYLHIEETVENMIGGVVNLGYARRHRLAVVAKEDDERTLLTYNAHSLIRVSDGDVRKAVDMQHNPVPEINIGNVNIGEVADGRALWLSRVCGAELLSEGTAERKKGRAAFLAGFLKPASHSL